MLEPKFHVSNSKNKDLLYNCIDPEQVVQMSGLRGLTDIHQIQPNSL